MGEDAREFIGRPSASIIFDVFPLSRLSACTSAVAAASGWTASHVEGFAMPATTIGEGIVAVPSRADCFVFRCISRDYLRR